MQNENLNVLGTPLAIHRACDASALEIVPLEVLRDCAIAGSH